MTTIITVTAQKGGVAKTTTSVTLGYGLAQSKARVLLVDLDPQGHVATSLGMDPEAGIFSVLVANDPAQNHIRYTGRLSLDILPSNQRTKTALTVLEIERRSLRSVADIFSQIGHNYDYMIFDTPASGLLQEAAISLAQVLIIPTTLDALSLDGVRTTIETTKQLNPQTKILILPSLYDKRLSLHQHNLTLLQEAYPQFIPAPIPARASIREASAVGETIWEYDKRCDSLVAWQQLLQRIDI